MFQPNDSEKLEINKTIHTEGWMLILKLYEDRAQNILNGLLTPAPLFGVDYSRGQAAAWKEAQKLPYETANKETIKEEVK